MMDLPAAPAARNMTAMRWAAIFLSFSLPFMVSAQSLRDITFGTDSTLDVLTWNIERFPKNGTATIDSVARVIEALDADLIGIQEVRDTAICRQMVRSIPGYKVHMDIGWSGGLAWVYKTSTVQIQSVYNILNTSPYWNALPRSPLVVEFQFAGADWVAINNHYKCCGDGQLDPNDPGDEENRRMEANNLLKQYLLLNHSSDRLIVLGDLNDNLMDPFQHNVFRMFIADSSRYRFADHALAQGPNYHWSYPTWPSHLDHILISDELFSFFPDPSASALTVRVDDFLPNGWADYDQFLSDHRPVGLKIPFSPSIGSEQQEQEVNWLVPNPTSKDVEIDLSELPNSESVEIRVYDAGGKCVLEERCPSTDRLRIELPEARGMYTVDLVSGDQRRTARVLKE